MKEKIKKKLEDVKNWCSRNSNVILFYSVVGLSGLVIGYISRVSCGIGYEYAHNEKLKDDLKCLAGEYEAHDAGFIKYFDPSTGTEVSRKEALELFKKS